MAIDTRAALAVTDPVQGRTVRELMSRRVVAGDRRDRLTAIARRMRREEVGAVAIVEAGRLIGIVTERDVVHAVGDGLDPRTTDAGSCMTTGPMTVRPGDSLVAAAGLMTALGVRHLPVVEDDRPVGFVSARDVVRSAAHRTGVPGRLAGT
jgi:CBS domain-containing protein